MRLKILENIEDNNKDEIFKINLKDAKYTYLRLVYPYHPEIEELPNDRARDWQTRCAIEIYNLDGDFHITSYAENGLQEVYSTSGLSRELLSELPPSHAGVPTEVKKVE